MFSRFDRIPRVTDGQTDGQTSCGGHSPRYAYIIARFFHFIILGTLTACACCYVSVSEPSMERYGDVEPRRTCTESGPAVSLMLSTRPYRSIELQQYI